jgi:hypothetical protein
MKGVVRVKPPQLNPRIGGSELPVYLGVVRMRRSSQDAVRAMVARLVSSAFAISLSLHASPGVARRKTLLTVYDSGR